LRLRLKKDIKDENIPMKLGRAKHEIIFKYTDACLKNKDADFGTMTKIVEKSFNKHKLPESEYESLRNEMVAFAEKGIDPEKILDIEKRKKVVIGKDDNGKDIQLEFVIDRVNLYETDEGSLLELIDYKSHQNVLARTAVEKDKQLNIYKYLACNYLYPNNKLVRTGIFHIRHNFCRWTDVKKIAECGEEFESMQAFLYRQWDRLINSEEYPPERGEHCFQYGGCPVMMAGECPLYSAKEVEKMKGGNIEDKVLIYRKMKLDMKKLEPQIKEYFKEHDTILIGEKEVGFVATQSYKYLLGKLLEFCKKYKYKLDKLLLGKTEVDKLLKTRDMPEDKKNELAECQEETVSSKFQI
jgi:hypothetical protein